MEYPKVWIDPEGIVHIDCGQRPRMGLEDMQRAYERHRALTDVARPVLISGLDPLRVEHGVERFASAPEVCALTAASALLVKSPWARILGEMFLFYHHPPYPSHLFTDRGEALAWLRGFLREGDGLEGPAGAEPKG